MEDMGGSLDYGWREHEEDVDEEIGHRMAHLSAGSLDVPSLTASPVRDFGERSGGTVTVSRLYLSSH